jgi:hypothetical protein
MVAVAKRAAAILGCVVAGMSGLAARGANQTPTLTPVQVGSVLPFTATIAGPTYEGDTLPGMHSFARAEYGGQWLLIAGMTNGQHNLGRAGFFSQYRNSTVYVIDPTTHQVWGRSIASDPTAGFTPDQLSSLMVTNSQYSQIGSHLYLTGGYGTIQSGTSSQWQTFSTLSSIDVPGMMNWVKTGTGTAASKVRQISDPLFQVTGGEMLTTSNGRTHLVFGQNYPTAYTPGVNGVYTHQVRSFTIVDDGTSLGIASPVTGATNPDFRRRDLNVVPVIREEGGQLVEKMQALAGVFTTDFGAWTVPVTIDASGNATEPDPTAAGTFKQGTNSYRSANIGMYSVTQKTMHTLLFGGISYQYYDAATGTFLTDANLPYTNDATDIVTDANGVMSVHLLPSSFPTLVDSVSGKKLLLGTETEFFAAAGVKTFANGVIDLDALTGTTLVGYLFGGIASDAGNGGTTQASNALFPVYVTVPEPGTLAVLGMGMVALWKRRGGRLPGGWRGWRSV